MRPQELQLQGHLSAGLNARAATCIVELSLDATPSFQFVLFDKDDWFSRDCFSFHVWFPDIATRLLQSWIIEDLSPDLVCLIGTTAHVDQNFRDFLTKRISLYTYPKFRGEQIVQEQFGIAAVIESFREVDSRLQRNILGFLIAKGTVERIKLFVEAGVDWEIIKGSHHQLLRLAIQMGSIEKVELLLSFGHDKDSALGVLTTASHLIDHDIRYQRLLASLVIRTKRRIPPSLDVFNNDSLLELFEQAWYSVKQPRFQLAEVILSRGNYIPERLLGTASREFNNRPFFCNSYVYWSILEDDARSLSLFLQHGANADEQIDQLFDCFQRFNKYIKVYYGFLHFSGCTWLGFALHIGSPSCASVLIKYGANVMKTDGHGQSAIQIVKSNMVALHPRTYDHLQHLSSPINGHTTHLSPMKIQVSSEKDVESLTIVREAFERQFPNSGKFDDYKNTGPQRLKSGSYDRAAGILQDLVTGFLDLLHRQGLMSGSLHSHLHDLWHSSFSDLLLMRFLYVVSYALLLWVSLQELATGTISLPKPSRTIALVTIAVPVALIWIASLLGSD